MSKVFAIVKDMKNVGYEISCVYNANNCDIQHVDWFAQQESYDSRSISDSQKMHDARCILHTIYDFII